METNCCHGSRGNHECLACMGAFYGVSAYQGQVVIDKGAVVGRYGCRTTGRKAGIQKGDVIVEISQGDTHETINSSGRTFPAFCYIIKERLL